MEQTIDVPITNTSAEEREKLAELGEAIATLSSHIDAAIYRMLVMIREFDSKQGWDPTGFASCAHWLAWRCGMTLGTAREKVRIAHALTDFPLIAEGLRKGELSYSKVRAITRVVDADSEQDFVSMARKATASQLERIVRAWRHVTGPEEREQSQRKHELRSLELIPGDDGMVHIKGRLTEEQGAVLLRALEAAQDQLFDENQSFSETPADQRRADALMLVAETALNAELDSGSRGDRYQVVVHIDETVLKDTDQPGQSRLEHGEYISAETSRRIACDSSTMTMTHDAGGNVLDVGRKSRTLTAPLRRALAHRDRYCRFPGCTNKFCDAHHLKHWAVGGETNLSNLIRLCSRHHHAVHEGGYEALDFENQLFFFDPSGLEVEFVPSRMPPQLVESLSDVAIDADTSGAKTTGAPMDLNHVIGVYSDRRQWRLDEASGTN